MGLYHHMGRLRRATRRGVVLLAGAAFLMTGCSNTVRVGMSQYPEDGTKRTRVVTRDGFEYDFARAYVEGDTLHGFYRVVEERVMPNGHLAYVDAPRHTHLPLSEVAYAEYSKFDYTGTALVGAGAVLMAIFIGGLSDDDDLDPLPGSGSGSGGTKPDDPL